MREKSKRVGTKRSRSNRISIKRMDSSTILTKQPDTSPDNGPGSEAEHETRFSVNNDRRSVAELTNSKQSSETNELHSLLKQIDSNLEDLSSRTADIHRHGGPDSVALSVVREAIAIGLTMTEGDEAESYRLPLRTMDHRYLENRSRALRTALHGVDDYVWWGGITEQ